MRSGFSLLLTVATFSCSQHAGTQDEAIRKVMEGIIEADNQRDVEMVLSFYDDDAVLVPQGRPEIAGTANIRANYESIFSTSELNLRIQIDSVMVSGGTALGYGVTIGTVTSIADKSEKLINDGYVMTLERKGGNWKITRLSWRPQ